MILKEQQNNIVSALLHPFPSAAMMQVRWNLKPTTTKDKKTLAATFNPLTERFKAHRDFEQHAHEVASSKKRKMASREQQQMASREQQQQPPKLTKHASISSSMTSIADFAASISDYPNSDTTTENVSSGSSDIGILDLDGCEELEYNLDLQEFLELDGENEISLGHVPARAPTPPPKHNPRFDIFADPAFRPTRSQCSVPTATLLSELARRHSLAESGMLNITEEDVIGLAADERPALPLGPEW